MNGSRPSDDDGMSSLNQVLGYEKHLPGDVFASGVMKAAARRRKRRKLVLGICAAVSTATTLAIMPEHFALPWNLGVALERIGSSGISASSGGLMALLIATILVIGASRTIDNI